MIPPFVMRKFGGIRNLQKTTNLPTNIDDSPFTQNKKGTSLKIIEYKGFFNYYKQRYILFEEMTIFCFADPTEAEQRSSRVASEWSEIKT